MPLFRGIPQPVPEGRDRGSDTAQGQSDKIQKPQKHTTGDLLSTKMEAAKLGRRAAMKVFPNKPMRLGAISPHKFSSGPHMNIVATPSFLAP